MRTPDIGNHVHYVQIQQLSESIGASSFPTEQWTDLTTAWMARRELSAFERFKAQQLSAEVDTKWITRYIPALDPDQIDVPKTRRLIYGGRVYDIVSAGMRDRREAIELTTIAHSKRAA